MESKLYSTCYKVAQVCWMVLLGLFFQHDTFSQVKAYNLNLDGLEYPFPVKHMEIEAQRQFFRMAYMDVVPTNPNGNTVVLMHGKSFNGAYWKRTADTLVKAGYRVIIPDQIGFGKSTKPRCFQYSFCQLAEITKRLLDMLGVGQASIVGHSMGGMLAVRFTLMYPERVARLVLENPIGLEDYRKKVPYQTLDSWYQKELKQDYESLKKYQMASYYHNKWTAEYTKWLEILAGWTLIEDYPVMAWNSALTTEMIMSQPVMYDFSNIKKQTLLIIGQLDKTALGKDLVPQEVQETMGNYPRLGVEASEKICHSRLVKIPDAGHVPHIEVFDEFIQPLVHFLENGYLSNEQPSTNLR